MPYAMRFASSPPPADLLAAFASTGKRRRAHRWGRIGVKTSRYEPTPGCPEVTFLRGERALFYATRAFLALPLLHGSLSLSCFAQFVRYQKRSDDAREIGASSNGKKNR